MPKKVISDIQAIDFTKVEGRINDPGIPLKIKLALIEMLEALKQVSQQHFVITSESEISNG